MALPYNVENTHDYHNVYRLGGYGLINMSGPQIVSLKKFKTVHMFYTRGVMISYNEWGPFGGIWPVGFKPLYTGIQSGRHEHSSVACYLQCI